MKIIHLCVDIRGALLNWKDREMSGVFLHSDGRKMTAKEAKLALMNELAKGRKVIPAVPCDNFDYQTGCRGHTRRQSHNLKLVVPFPTGE